MYLFLSFFRGNVQTTCHEKSRGGDERRRGWDGGSRVWGVAGEGGPDAWHHSLIFPARTELWFLQVRTVAAAEGATPPAVPRRVLSNLRSWGGFKKKTLFNPPEEPVKHSSLDQPQGRTRLTQTRGLLLVLMMKMWGFISWAKRKRNSAADKKGRHTSLSLFFPWLCPAAFVC